MTSSLFTMRPVAALALLASATGAQAQLAWAHGDWQLVCDNTRTCRAAGYTTESATLRSTVLIERTAGPGTPLSLSWKVEVGESAAEEIRPPVQLKAGALSLKASQPTLGAEDSAKLVAAMLNAPHLGFEKAGSRWRLPLSGLKAVMLKMDEAQGRLDTPGATVRKGSRAEAEVPPALPAPRPRVLAALSAQAADASTLPLMWAAVRERGCWESLPDSESPSRAAERLDSRTWLLVRECSRGAYQGGSMAWLVSTTPPYRPKPVSFPTSQKGETLNELVNLEIGHGLISSAAKGRGVGDCWSSAEWGWTGERFELLSESSTGLCRGFAGGAWELPTYVTERR
ncbi:DUF1176 domain-containing protein [Ideonella paludis]|uniref:DUF1176 domain-containing protein n=1 Tax=Ideonella paludis TaxID=1233411 RepID=A0ABS5DSH6_9BURK|nr:DUF1176 domain-containing protein [Ideonella paludis]MBQ0934100.1 DUF1176 domain-containing protein [Ideonella paludis]